MFFSEHTFYFNVFYVKLILHFLYFDSFLYLAANHRISAKHTSGTMNPNAIETWSAMNPISMGAMAPPTIDIIR